MTPRTGRPPAENPKKDRITIRLTMFQQNVLNECAKKFGTTKADVLSRGLTLMEIEKDCEEARQLFDAIVVLQEVKKSGLPIDKQLRQVEKNFGWYTESIKK